MSTRKAERDLDPIEYMYTVPYPVSTNRMYRMGQGHMHLSSAARDYKIQAGAAADYARLVAGAPTMQGPVILELNVYRPQVNADLSNCLKCLEDSMKGIVFNDDSQVVDIRMVVCKDERRDKRKTARVEVTVRAAIA